MRRNREKDEEKCGHHKGYEIPSERLVYDPKSLGVGNCLVRIRSIAFAACIFRPPASTR